MTVTSDLIQKLYIGYFGRAGDPSGLEYWVERKTAGMTDAAIAQSFSVQDEATAMYGFLAAPSLGMGRVEFLNSVYNNLFGREIDDEGSDYWLGQLDAGRSVGGIILDIINGAQDTSEGQDLTIINNKLAVANYYTEAVITSNLIWTLADHQQDAIDVLADVDDTDDSVSAGEDLADDLIAAATAPAGQSFTLTTGVDYVSGGAGDDFVSAVVGGNSRTANLEDDIDLSTGTDTANLRMVATFEDGNTGAFDGVENVNLRVVADQGFGVGYSANDVNIVFPDMTSLSVQNNAFVVNITGLDYAQTTVTLAGTTGAVTLDGTGATANVVLGANFASTLDVDTATRLNVSISDDTTVVDVVDQNLTSLYVSGTGDFTLEDLSEEGLTTINTTGLTGDVDLSGVGVDAAAGNRKVTLGAGDDRLALIGALDDATNETTFAGGDGTDTLVIDTAINDASGTTGFEIVELAASITFEADSVSGLETIVVAGSTSGDLGTITHYTSDIELILSDSNASAATDTLAISVTPDDDSLDGTTDAITIAIATTVDSDDELTVDNVGVQDDDNSDTFETLNINVSGTRGVIISDIDDDSNGAILSTTININSSVDLTVSDMQLASGEDVTVDFGSSTGTIVATIATADLEAGDVVTGGAATDDVLNLNIGAVTVDAEISGFETIAVEASGAGTFSLADVTATTIEINNAAAAFSVTNAVSGQDFVLTDGGNFNVTINAASTSSTINVALTENLTATTLVTGANVIRVNIDNSEFAQAAAEWDLGAAVTTLYVSGDEDIDLAVSTDLSKVTTLNLSDLEAEFDGDSFTLGDGVTVTLSGNADDSSFSIDGTNAVVDRFVFGDDIATGVQIDISEFKAGFANGDVLNLSALGVTSIADLTVAWADGASAGIDGDETLTITAVDTDMFAGSIVLTGTYNGTGDLASNNFVFV